MQGAGCSLLKFGDYRGSVLWARGAPLEKMDLTVTDPILDIQDGSQDTYGREMS